MRMFGFIASMFFAVSRSVSPLETLEVAELKLITSADNRFPAISNEVRVRVLASKKRFTAVLPGSAGSFLMSRVSTSSIERAVSMTNSISSTRKSARPSTCRRFQSMASPPPCRCGFVEQDLPVLPVPLDHYVDGLVPGGGDVPADIIRADGKLPVPTIDQNRQLDILGAAEVDQGVHRRPYRTSREQNVVHEDDFLLVDRKRDFRAFQPRLVSCARQVVPVERDVHVAGRNLQPLDGPDFLPDELRQRHTAGHDADQNEILGSLVFLQDLVGQAGEAPLHSLGVQDDLLACFFHRDGPSEFGRNRVFMGKKKPPRKRGEAAWSSTIVHPLLTSRD